MVRQYQCCCVLPKTAVSTRTVQWRGFRRWLQRWPEVRCPGEFVSDEPFTLWSHCRLASHPRKQHLSVIDQIDHHHHHHILCAPGEINYSRNSCRMDRGRYQMLPSGWVTSLVLPVVGPPINIYYRCHMSRCHMNFKKRCHRPTRRRAHKNDIYYRHISQNASVSVGEYNFFPSLCPNVLIWCQEAVFLEDFKQSQSLNKIVAFLKHIFFQVSSDFLCPTCV